MLKKLTKSGLALSMHWTGVDRMVGRRRGLRNAPLVISYHRVVEDFRESARHTMPSMLISTRTLSRHLDWLGRHYDFLSLDDVADILEGRKAPGARPGVAVTFDDGYADFYHHAFPVLKSKGVPGAVFVVSDLLDSKRLQLHDEIFLLTSGALSQSLAGGHNPLCDAVMRLEFPRLKSARICRAVRASGDPFKVTRAVLETLSQEEMKRLVRQLRTWIYVPEERLCEFHSLDTAMCREMLPQGITVGSHTRTHALLANESWDKVLDEVAGSRRDLERRLDTRVEHFAYPDGRFNENAVCGVAEARYRCAYTICTHQDAGHPRLTIPRRVLWENSSMDSFGRFSSALMSCQFNGIFDPAAKCRQEHWA